MSADGTGAPGSPADESGDLLSQLTPREREVLMLYLECQNPKRIAPRLGTRPQTVKNQLASIKHKLRVDSREGLLVYVLTRIKG